MLLGQRKRARYPSTLHPRPIGLITTRFGVVGSWTTLLDAPRTTEDQIQLVRLYWVICFDCSLGSMWHGRCSRLDRRSPEYFVTLVLPSAAGTLKIPHGGSSLPCSCPGPLKCFLGSTSTPSLLPSLSTSPYLLAGLQTLAGLTMQGR